MSIEAMKQAYQILITEPHSPTACDKLEVILRQAIAEAEKQEPVDYEKLAALGWQAIECGICGGGAMGYPQPKREQDGDCQQCGGKGCVACDARKQEPVATWENKYGMKEWQVHALRAGWSLPPPQRQWVGLTPQERDEINEQVYGAVPHHVAFHAAIEAKLKELNK